MNTKEEVKKEFVAIGTCTVKAKKTLVEGKYQYTVTLPAKWFRVSGINEDADFIVRASNSSKDVYLEYVK